jgi:hypothetical protein
MNTDIYIYIVHFVAFAYPLLLWKSNIASPLYYFDLHVAVDNINLWSVAMETEVWISFARFSCYEIFRTVANRTILLRSSRKVSEIVARL